MGDIWCHGEHMTEEVKRLSVPSLWQDGGGGRGGGGVYAKKCGRMSSVWYRACGGRKRAIVE